MLDALYVVLALAYIALGVAVTRSCYGFPRKPSQKILVASFVCTMFFSFSIIVGRVALPCPTLIALLLTDRSLKRCYTLHGWERHRRYDSAKI